MTERVKPVEQGSKESATNVTRSPAQIESVPGLSQSPSVSLLTLQRTRGNRFVQGLLSSALNKAVIQRKCECGSSAERKTEDERPSLQRQADRQTEPPAAPSIVSEVLSAPGDSLTPEIRRFMEPRFDADFSAVRVHTDERAAESARAVNARAYTVGQHVVFDQGEYNTDSASGKELLAHELAHVLQQGWGRSLAQGSSAEAGNNISNASAFQAKFEISQPSDPHEQEADRIAQEVMRMPDPAAGLQRTGGCELDGDCPARKGFSLQRSIANPAAASQNGDGSHSIGMTAFRRSHQVNGISSIPQGVLQRVPPPPPPCSTRVDFSFTQPVHVPHCATTALRATTDGSPITWSLEPDTATVDPGTTIAANGTITISPSQPAGEILARATGASGCTFERPFQIRSHPTGISSTTMVSVAGPPDFGGVFNHTFISADGHVASLHNVAVGERFIGVPTPTAATHAITAPTHPFGGTFTLSTSTLEPDATNNWFLTTAGQLNGGQDSVAIGRAGINVGRFIQSASNPSPARGLPATMTLIQGLHWFCPQAPAASRWRTPPFVRVAHSRTLRKTGGTVEFVTTVNGLELVETYDGPTGVLNATASPASTPRTAAGAAAATTVRITADTLPTALPAGQAMAFSIVGAAIGCTIAADPTNDHAAILTIGTTSGDVVVEVADSTGVNRARVTVTIT